MITAAMLRECLAATVPPRDPLAVVMPEGSSRWPDDVRARLTAELRPAAVLVPVIDRGGAELSLLLTRRSAELRHHAGQVSFPGGSMEPADASLTDAALRETHEEVGIPPASVDVVGHLQPMPTITGFAVTPVVGVVRGDVELTIDTREVESAFEVPMAYLLESGNGRRVERELFGRMTRLVEYHYDGQRIWGATAFIIQQFIKQLSK